MNQCYDVYKYIGEEEITMPVVNKNKGYIELYLDGKLAIKTADFSLIKPNLFIRNINKDLPVIRTKTAVVWISLPDMFIMSTGQIVSYVSFLSKGMTIVRDLTLLCDGIYISFDLPEMEEEVKKLKRGKGIILP